MQLKDALISRHSVRSYREIALNEEIVNELEKEIKICNSLGDLHIQLVLNEPKAFDCLLSHYGKFHGVMNYIALVGKKSEDLEERCGYYGEHLVLKAQQLGLNTCWVAVTYKKIASAFEVGIDEKIVSVIAIGYGETSGKQHNSKKAKNVSNINEDSSEWFKLGVEAALLAPTAMNQQKFYIEQHGNHVRLETKRGAYTKLDLGIVKYHFEIGAGKDHFEWVK